MINYTSKPKKRKCKKVLTVLVFIVVLVFAAVSAVGIIASSDSEKRQAVSGAIEENAQLKFELEQQNNEIAELRKKTEALEEELKSRPSPSPTPFEIKSKSDGSGEKEEKISPRANAEE